MKFQDDISKLHTYIHTYIHTHGQAEINMSPLLQSWGHRNIFISSAPDDIFDVIKRRNKRTRQSNRLSEGYICIQTKIVTILFGTANLLNIFLQFILSVMQIFIVAINVLHAVLLVCKPRQIRLCA